jgi:hypothetical protein
MRCVNAVNRRGPIPLWPTLWGGFGGRPPGSLADPTRTTSRGMPSPNFRNRIGGYRKNFETGPRLSNSLPQREGARLPPGPRRASRLLFQGFHPVPGHFGGPALQPPDCVRSGPTALWRVQRDSYTSPDGACQVGHVEEVQDMPRARLWRLLQVLAASAAPFPLPDAAQTPP